MMYRFVLERTMTPDLEAVRAIALAEIHEARKRIAGTIVRTPLVRLESLDALLSRGMTRALSIL